jgi:NAD(P)-dependent dehydrogenase (short-subunit alcohol dehydrogenase family)
MSTSLSGKVILCAGSATGIGAECALRMAAEGAHLIIGDLNLDAAQELVDKIEALPGRGLAVQFDISDPASVQQLIAKGVSHFGGLDGMHINATDRLRNREDFDLLSTELDVFDRVLLVSLRGHLLCARAGLPEMLKRGGGAIVFTSSDSGKTPANVRMAYSIAKAGLNALMRHVAFRYGREGIRANCVSPGVVMTDAMIGNTTEEERQQMAAGIPSTGPGTPEDIAGVVAFLMSQDARYINGQAISINGGKVMAIG